ncbi:MAG TPA: hypothetical protein VGH27_07815 [Streptosporangiaceae bacterium]|jgi:hypothetical protein
MRGARLARSCAWARQRLALVCAVAVTGLGLLGAPSARGASPGRIEDAGVAYPAPECTINGGGATCRVR